MKNSDHSTTEFRTQATKASAQDHLGIDPTGIPPITAFVNVPGGNTPAPDPLKGSDHTDWASKLLAISEDVVQKSGMSVVIAELSVLTDTLALDSDPFFTTNIVCSAESNLENETPILGAYLSAIRNIDREGTTINIPEFHILHYVHVIGPGRLLPRGRFSSISCYRDNVSVTPLDPKYTRQNQEVDFERHHRDFFDHFLSKLNLKKSNKPKDQLHYLALPFQRPEHVTAILDTGFSARLEPAGALYLVLQPIIDFSEKLEPVESTVSTIAAKLQHICTLSCLKASSLIADSRAMVAASNEARLRAYDGIGHALRAFVEATKYEGALELLSAVQHDERLPKDLVKTIAHVRKSLAFFEHAEALGSLMRLHGWLGVYNGARKRQFPKVIECFDEEQVQAIQERKLDIAFLVTAAASVIASLAAALAYKDEVVFRIRHAGTQAHSVQSVLVSPEIEISPEVEPEPALPPLRSDGDRGAVFLAVRVALLEPLRNASMHIRGREPASAVEVLLEARTDGVITVYIGNRWYGSGASDVDMLTLSTGLGLVQKMLQECHLGRFFNASSTDLQKQIRALIDPEDPYHEYVWIGIEIDPLALYTFAKRECPSP